MSASAHVVVVGGGPAGVAAALAAARVGARVTLLERHGFVGGNMTLGLCMHTFENARGIRVIEGLPAEFIGRMQKVGASTGSVPIRNAHMYSTTPVDVEMVKLVAFSMLLEAGVDVRVLSPVSGVRMRGRAIDALQVATIHGVTDIAGDVFVDATGTAIWPPAPAFPSKSAVPGTASCSRRASS